jgi:hypothetical protein
VTGERKKEHGACLKLDAGLYLFVLWSFSSPVAAVAIPGNRVSVITFHLFISVDWKWKANFGELTNEQRFDWELNVI